MSEMQTLGYGWSLSATIARPARGTEPPLVGQWMSSPARMIPAATPLIDAYQMMMRWDIRRLPVVSGTQLIGIVTLGDLREARPAAAGRSSIYELNYQLARLTVAQVMTHHPFVITPPTPIVEAAQLMLEQKIGGLPVVDPRGVLVGIITESDLFRGLIQHWDPGDRGREAGPG